FGLAVLDLGTHGELPMPLQSRLVGLAQKHRSAIVCLTEKAPRDASLSSLVSLRVETWRKRQPDGRLLCGVRALKDKHRGPGWEHSELLRGPPGLR
ncbi:MAG: recombinase A, partial [Planctomycetes bacterium]|nr:recombinase A [Planctomycetota bacterium]